MFSVRAEYVIAGNEESHAPEYEKSEENTQEITNILL